ncbi:MAG: hypothetical protein Tsb0034_25730 [Ekhidna sp.]
MCLPFVLFSQTWREARQSKEATLDLYWFTSRPFIYEENEELKGIEPDLLSAFKDYIQKSEGVDIQLNWIKAKSFSGILDVVRNDAASNIVGVSALSITPERKIYADFSTKYLPDITVLVSSEGTPIVRSFDEINRMMNEMEAITIAGTKYEKMLLDMKSQLNATFKIKYIDSESNVLEVVSKEENKFGFIDLPVYLLAVQNGGDLTRQNFFTLIGGGYSFMFPEGSDWVEPFNRFIEDPANRKLISQIISDHMGEELYSFIDNIYAGEQVGTSILTKEKEMQLALIQNANLELERQQSLKNLLIIGIVIFGIFLLIIGYLFYKNQKTAKLLIGQKDQIYDQKEDIRAKNEQLMNRNSQLMSLIEEKNNLVKILAHDIRSPLSQITMITEILSNASDEAEDRKEEFLKQIGLSAKRINDMVSKILDVDNAEDDKIRVMRERVDLRDIFSDIRNRYTSQAAKKDIRLKVNSCTENYIIRTDHLLMTLVLENLVSNAIKFSPPNTTVILEADCKYDGVLIKVSDEGPGFTEEDKQHLFEKFHKLSARPTAGESSIGLGLSIVKKYVNDLGGEVWLESEEGKGSTFFVKLTV